MADSIIKCIEIFDALGNIEVRIVHYRLEYANHVLFSTADVHVNEMTDPQDLEECKEISNTKIAATKSRWIDTLANSPHEEEISDLNGSL